MSTPHHTMKVTEDEYRAMQERVKGSMAGCHAESLKVPSAMPSLHGKDRGREAGGRIPSPPYRSKLEAAYAGYLHVLMLSGEIQRYAYEPIRLNLAPKTTLTPDFLVVNTDGSIEFHETKGWARDDAMAKLKIAARLYPQWKFWLVKRKRGAWEQRELPV